MEMKINEIYQTKHELWLKILYSSFAIPNEKIKTILYDFSQMSFRHLKWLSNDMKQNNIDYNYNKNFIDIQKNTTFELLEFLINEIKISIKSYDPKQPLFARILSDEYQFIITFNELLQDKSNDDKIEAFNRKRVYENKNLTDQSRDALTIFLFEESYKEYELILLYGYFQNYTDNILQYNVYQDMIDESWYHLKSFGNMMAKMGILAIPRTVIQDLYINKDITQFLKDGINEEIKAKDECKELASMIDDDQISKFLEFIMYQENYHIELMRKALQNLQQ